MKLKVTLLAVLLLHVIAPACCSPWRKSQSDHAGGDNNAIAKKTASNQAPLSPNAGASPSSLSSTDSPASHNAFQVLLQMTAWLKQASDPSSFHKLACSSDALSSWTNDCDALSTSEEHRLQLATLLTICHHQRNSKATIPIECLEWLQTAAGLDSCIDSFSRSPQYWNSFNSFSSKVSDTCHVLAREQNLAVFKQVFQKFLFHQQQFQDDILQHDLLKQEKEKALEERMSSWFGRFEKYFTSMNQQYDDHSSSLATTFAKHSQQSQAYKQELDALLHSFRTSMTQLPLAVREMAAQEAEFLREHLYDAVKSFQQQNEVALKQHSSMHNLAMKKVLDQSELALNEIVYGLGTQLGSLAKNLQEADVTVMKHVMNLLHMQEQGSSTLDVLTKVKSTSEDSVELALSHQAIIQQMFQDQIEATAKLVNATRQAYTDVMWGSILSMNWLTILAAGQSYYKNFLSTTHLRLASTSVAITLLVATWPEYFHLVTYIPSVIHRGMIALYQFLYHTGDMSPISIEEADALDTLPWRTEHAKEWFAV